MPRDQDKQNKEKGVLESAVEGVVDFVKENTGLSGQAARDLEGRRDVIERETRTKEKKKPRGN